MALLCPDLLFGSRVEGALEAAGHDVARFDSPDAVRGSAADVVVVDLTAAEYDGPEAVASLGPSSGRVPMLGFYAHVDQQTRRRAEEAGFDRVVPRSRMARETTALVEGLLGG